MYNALEAADIQVSRVPAVSAARALNLSLLLFTWSKQKTHHKLWQTKFVHIVQEFTFWNDHPRNSQIRGQLSEADLVKISQNPL